MFCVSLQSSSYRGSTVYCLGWVIQKYLLNHLPSQVNSKVLTGDIADQTSWIKKVQTEVNVPTAKSIMAAAFRCVYSFTTGLIVIPAAQLYFVDGNGCLRSAIIMHQSIPGCPCP